MVEEHFSVREVGRRAWARFEGRVPWWGDDVGVEVLEGADVEWQEVLGLWRLAFLMGGLNIV